MDENGAFDQELLQFGTSDGCFKGNVIACQGVLDCVKKPLELVHSDVCGPTKQKSRVLRDLHRRLVAVHHRVPTHCSMK